MHHATDTAVMTTAAQPSYGLVGFVLILIGWMLLSMAITNAAIAVFNRADERSYRGKHRPSRSLVVRL